MTKLMDLIYNELFPPDGMVNIKKIDRNLIDHIESIKEHVAAIESVCPAKSETIAPEAKKTITETRQESLEFNERIAELRETPGENGELRGWEEIKALLEYPNSADTLRKRYNKYKRRIKNPLLSEEDEYILKMHNEGGTDSEISVAFSRDFGKPLKVTYIERRIREIKHILGEA